MIKEGWIRKNAILNIPALILQDLIKQKMQKRALVPVSHILASPKVVEPMIFVNKQPEKSVKDPQYKDYVNNCKKSINGSTSASQLIQTSNYLKNVMHLRKRSNNVATYWNSPNSQSSGLKAETVQRNVTSADDEEIDVYGRESDRQLVMYHEIDLELKSQSLQKVMGEKKKKYADLVLRNNAVLGQIKRIEEVSCIYGKHVGNKHTCGGLQKESNCALGHATTFAASIHSNQCIRRRKIACK